MANTFVAIATTTVGSGGQAAIEFTSIPATYTDLVILTSLRNAASDNGRFNVKTTFNGSSSGYSQRLLYGTDGSTVDSDSGTEPYIHFYYGNQNGTTASTFANGMIYIPNYAGSNNKSALFDSVTENNSSSGFITAMTAALWSNSSAITSIKMEDILANNLVQYSTATLYGIKNS